MLNNEEVMMRVAVSLNLSTTALNKIPIEQIVTIDKIMTMIPYPFNEVVNHVTPDMLEASFLSVGLNGCNGKEIPFRDVCSACTRAGIPILSMAPKHTDLILRALCRNPETKIINCTLFYQIYKYWYNRKHQKSSRVEPVNASTIATSNDDDYSELYLLLDSSQFEESGCKCIVELIFERVFPRGEMNRRLTPEISLDQLWQSTGVRINPIQLPLIRDLFLRAKVLITSHRGELVIVTQSLFKFLVHINSRKSRRNVGNDSTHRERRKTATTITTTLDPARTDIKQTRVIRSLLPYWSRIINTLLENTSCNLGELQSVNKSGFRSAAEQVGSPLGLADLNVLWIYFQRIMESSSDIDSDVKDVFLRDELTTIPVITYAFRQYEKLHVLEHQNMKISDVIRDQPAPRILKEAPQFDSFPSQSLSSVAGLLKPPSVLTLNAKSQGSQPSDASQSSLPWQNSDVQTTSLPNGCIRLRDRVKRLSQQQKQGIVRQLRSSNSAILNDDMRSFLSEILSAVGIWQSHKEIDELLDMVTKMKVAQQHNFHSSDAKPRSALDLIIDFFDLAMFTVTSAASSTSTASTERAQPKIHIQEPTSAKGNRRYSASHENVHSTSSFGSDRIGGLLEWDTPAISARPSGRTISSDFNNIRIDYQEQNNSIEQDIHNGQSTKIESFVHPELIDNVGEVTASTNSQTENLSLIPPQSDGIDMKLILQDCNERSVADDSIENTDHDQISAAVEILCANRASIAYIFRKLAYPGCRLSEYSVKCRSFADALLQPPLELRLTRWQSWKLVCQMCNISTQSDFEISTLLFEDVIRYLDQCKAGGLDSKLLSQSIAEKLFLSGTVRGDKLRLLAQTPILRQRLRQILSKGKGIICWEDPQATVTLTAAEIRGLLATIDVSLTSAEATHLCKEAAGSTSSLGKGTVYYEQGATLANIIMSLVQLLTQKS